MKYAEVILPLPIANTYSYRIPVDMERTIKRGCRVVVHFGKKRYYTGIVMHIGECLEEDCKKLKEIFLLLDIDPILRRPQLRFWEWISSYYLCTLGDVYKAALPSGLKIESESVVIYNEDFQSDVVLKTNEQALLDILSASPKMTVSDLQKQSGINNVIAPLNLLLSKGAVTMNEELKKGYEVKKQTYVKLTEAYADEESVRLLFDSLRRAKAQEHLFLSFVEYTRAFRPAEKKEISKKELLEQSGCSNAVLKALVDKGVLAYYEKEVSRLLAPLHSDTAPSSLTESQQKAYLAIHASFKQQSVCLLHGVVSSGKTEIYIHLIQDALRAGKQVLYLLPEIAITTQITERLSKHFGKSMYVYHSGLPDNERVEIWNQMLHPDKPLFILGVRSSVFLPFSDLGLVIVDEEHEVSYKQQEPAPRYHAANAAIVLASMHDAKVLLGSATPSFESYYNARTEKYGYVTLTERYGKALPPAIQVVDVKTLRKRKQMKNTLFSPVLKEAMTVAFEKGEQVILFQNRRGYSPIVECRSCGWIPKCLNCDVSLTYHKYKNQLLCHYCGFAVPLPAQCPSCSSADINTKGFGTEQVAAEIETLFPDVKAVRMDTDTVRSRRAYEQVVADFEKGKTQLLIGTQMISKGLDFERVSIVGILNADSLMNFPDFRAYERAFQLMMQVSGRAGRRDEQGAVFLQTSQPEHPLLQHVANYNYEGMIAEQLAERELFHYPPYYRLIVIVLRSKHDAPLHTASRLYGEHLRAVFGERVLGPVTPPVSRVQTFYIRHILLKIETHANVYMVRERLEQVKQEMLQYVEMKKVLLHYNVDPL